jgi:hypothetical protein
MPSLILPARIAGGRKVAGKSAARSFLDFFTRQIRNRNIREKLWLTGE